MSIHSAPRPDTPDANRRLRQKGTGDVYVWTSALASRNDMVEIGPGDEVITSISGGDSHTPIGDLVEATNPPAAQKEVVQEVVAPATAAPAPTPAPTASPTAKSKAK